MEVGYFYPVFTFATNMMLSDIVPAVSGATKTAILTWTPQNRKAGKQ